jgi:peptidoglycan/xylan/chitin deacetylase (PgdA/CDA1 family)
MVRFLIPVITATLFFCNNDLFSIHSGQADPLVVITFDDAFESIYRIGFRQMRLIDTTWTATHFFPNDFINQEGNVTLDQLKEMEVSGWENGGHGRTHVNLSILSVDTMEAMVKESHDYLVQHGLSHESFAYASGMYNEQVKTVVARYFENIRTARDYYYLDGVDRQNLGYYAVKSGCTSNDLITRIEDAKRSGSLLVIIGFHVILPDTTSPLPIYWCKESVFHTFLLYLRDQHIQAMSIRDAIRIIKNKQI